MTIVLPLELLFDPGRKVIKPVVGILVVDGIPVAEVIPLAAILLADLKTV
jgi:hypothetical protein